jgi:multimeric flavodoxin WrbA
MKALIFDGSAADDPQSAKVNAGLFASLRARGWDITHILLREQKIGNCAGDFFCWVRNPGMCNIDDDNRLIAAKVVRSDLLIYLTPVTFGGYALALKRMVDHQVQNILPYFARIEGETHHQRRYRSYPDMLVIGWMDGPDPQAEAIFRHLVHRNALNMHARTAVCGLVARSQTGVDTTAQVGIWLEAIARGSSSPVPALPERNTPLPDVEPVRRAVLLVGSPRTRKSSSAALGGFLFEQLSARGTQTETIQVYTAFSSAERTRAALKTLDSADLVVLAFPLYVDSLPAPVIAALEKIAAHRKEYPSQAHFAAIANCGFPEAGHNSTALAICSEFASQSGLTWAGALALGGGEGIIHGTPLNELDGRAIPLKKALEMAAEALAAGKAIPLAAVDLMAKPIIPAWLYLLSGIYGWRQQAKPYGMQRNLKRRPYEAVEAER